MQAGLVAIALLAGRITLVILGAEAFFDGLLATARRVGVSSFFLTVLVSGLEVENIAAGLAANLSGFPGAAAGTFLGGTTFIALGIAGVSALLVPFRVRLSRLFLCWTALAGAPLLLLSRDRALSRIDGLILIAYFCIAMLSLHRTTGELGAGQLFDDDDVERKRYPWAWLLGGLAAMTAGGELLGNGLQAVVSRFGIPPTLPGSTAVAALTEAEEISRIAVPARRGRPDMATANIGGTVIHFLTLNAGILAVVAPLPLDEATMRLHLTVAVAAPAVLCLVLLLRGGLARLEGLVLLALYVGYVAAAIASR